MGKKHAPIRLVLTSTEELENTLDQMPLVLREKIAKKALREAGEIFESRVRKNIAALKAEGRDRWGKVSVEEIEESITKTIRPSRKTAISVRVRAHSSDADVNRYAASVEYGHRMFIYGEEIEGERVPQYPFWRPAQTATQMPIHRLFVRALKRGLKQLAKHAPFHN